LQNPTKVQPVETQMSIAGTDFSHEFPPYSFTVLRLKTR
jgi:hypothetical protein